MTKPRRKRKEPPKTMTAFRFREDTMNRLDSLLLKPPQYLFDGFRGFPRSKTELLEVLIYLVSEGKLQPVNPAQPPASPQV